MKSKKARKQRKESFNAPIHKKRKRLSAHLEEKLLLKYDKRSLPVINGDTVKVMRGSFKGHEDKVAGVNVKKGYVQIEGLTMIKADGKKIAKPIHPSNLLITKLDLTDIWRREKLEAGLSTEIKKEIEEEAEEQIKEREEKEKELAEEKKPVEKTEEKTEKKAPKKEETKKTETKTPEKTEKDKKKPKEKKEEKTAAAKKTTAKKTSKSKTSTKKKTTTKKKNISKKTTGKKKKEEK